MSKAPAAPGEVEMRLRPALNVLWAADPIAAQAAEASLLLLAEAGRSARELWPSYYFDEPVLRLVYDPSEPPSAETLATARRLGVPGLPYAGALEARMGACDIALIGPDAPEAAFVRLPILTLAGSGPLLTPVSPHSLPLPRIAGESPPREARAATAKEIAEAALAPPRGSRQRAELTDYQREDLGARPLRFEYDLLLRCIGERAPASVREDDSWTRAAELAGAETGAGLDALRRDHERADALALAYGRRWRSKLAARSFLLFAANLASGLIGASFPHISTYTLLFQTAATAFTYVDQFVAKRGRWRDKWLQYRRLAEATRTARFCVLGGVPVPVASPPTWIDWRVARAVRAAAVPTAVTEPLAPRFVAYLLEVEIERQILYHAKAHRRFHRLDARLRLAAALALFATFAVGAVFALAGASGAIGISGRLMAAAGLVASAGPGLYAALNGLRLQLDVARQADRSARRAVALRQLRRAIEEAPTSAALARAAASRAAEIMHEDVQSFDLVMEIV